MLASRGSHSLLQALGEERGLSARRGGRRFRQILKKIVHTKQEMGKTMRAGAFALTEAKYAAGEFNHTVLDSVEAVRPRARPKQP